VSANPIKSLIHRAGRRYIRRLCDLEANSQAFSHQNERPMEYGFALRALTENRSRTILDVGTGTTAWPHLLRNCGFVVTAIDNVRDYWADGMINRHWRVLDVDITKPGGLQGRFEAITCISVIEHIENHLIAVGNMISLLAQDGILILTCPYNYSEYSPDVYKRPDAIYGQDAGYICRSYSEKQLCEWLALGLKVEKRELWRLFSGPVWATGSRVAAERAESQETPHQLGCFVLRKV
jgi:SAM-dependent methyltransferase